MVVVALEKLRIRTNILYSSGKQINICRLNAGPSSFILKSRGISFGKL